MATKTAERPAAQQAAAPKQAPTDNLPAQAKAAPPIVQFRDYVQARMATLEDALPPTITPKRFVSVVMTALQNKPKLLECTFQSLWNACVRAAQDGLLPDGREGAIAPYGENKDGKRVAEIATWMPMIEGYRKKIFEAGHVKSWVVEVVHEKDEFEYELGDSAYIRHKPYFGEGSPGNVVGAYSIARLTTGETVREVMSAFKIKQVQEKSRAGNGPWKDAAFFPEMCKKVVGRRHYKQLPHSESMDAMIARDDQEHGLLDPADTPRVAPPATRRLTSREAFDTYAGGEVIDHETGEVTEADRADFDQQEQTTSSTATTGPAGGGAKEAAAKPAPAAASTNAAPTGTEASTGAGAGNGTTTASAPTGQQVANSSGEKTGASGASEEDGATTGNAPVASSSTADMEEEQVDGADRPWPPGAEPSSEAEYERYLRTELEKITDASKVAPWWNSTDQKALREKCKVVTRFKEFQDIAVARRTELGKNPVR